MTTQASGGKITGILALTLQAQSALNDSDPVHIVGDYECDVADGSKPVVGFVSVRNVGRGSTLTGSNPNAGFYPVPNVPGDVTVEARGFAVMPLTSSAAVTAGNMVGIDGARTVVSWAPGAQPVGATPVGIALEGATGSGQMFDVLVGPSA